MKLTDLNPKIEIHSGLKYLTFDCPKHCDLFDNGKHNNHTFQIPVDGQSAWQINSEDFNTLTLRPSVQDLTKVGGPTGTMPCGVHFYITAGEIQIL